MSYDSNLQQLFREAPQATGRLQAVVFIFQGAQYRFVKSYQDIDLSIDVGGPTSTFTAAGFEIDQPQVTEDQQQLLTISFPAAGTDLYRAVNFFANNRSFFEVEVFYLEYYIDGNAVDTDPGYKIEDLYARSVSVNAKADVQMQCTTDNLRTFTVGDLYTYDKFYALNNL